MRKEILFVVAIILFASIIGTQSTLAQETPKVEVGGQYIFLRDEGSNASGIGGIFAYNFTENIGADVAFNFFPSRDRSVTSGSETITIRNVKYTQGFFGIKSGIRSEKAGVFAKFRPGFLKTGDTNVSPGSSHFAMDIGGVLELYSTRNLGFRFDVGDTIVRYSGGGSSFTNHNMQLGAGIMFRF